MPIRISLEDLLYDESQAVAKVARKATGNPHLYKSFFTGSSLWRSKNSKLLFSDYVKEQVFKPIFSNGK
jgi:hypothetical protein